MFAQEWSCDRCTYKQPAVSIRCEMCQNLNPFIVNSHESYQSYQSSDYHLQSPSSTTPTQPSTHQSVSQNQELTTQNDDEDQNEQIKYVETINLAKYKETSEYIRDLINGYIRQNQDLFTNKQKSSYYDVPFCVNQIITLSVIIYLSMKTLVYGIEYIIHHQIHLIQLLYKFQIFPQQIHIIHITI